jgi:hypothetical protein
LRATLYELKLWEAKLQMASSFGSHFIFSLLFFFSFVAVKLYKAYKTVAIIIIDNLLKTRGMVAEKRKMTKDKVIDLNSLHYMHPNSHMDTCFNSFRVAMAKGGGWPPPKWPRAVLNFF